MRTQAIILAAGRGRRLEPLTRTIPKCLVPVQGKPLLVRTLEHLEDRGIRNVVLVVGHLREQVYRTIGHRFGRTQISYVENELYSRTNNVYSLWLARDRLDADSLLIECDLHFDGRLIDALLRPRRDCNVLVSPYDPTTMEGTVVEIDRDHTIRGLTVKARQGRGFSHGRLYKTVNMYFWSRAFLQHYLLPYLDLYVRVHGRRSYYELVLGLLAYLGEPRCHAVIVAANRWCEIDDEVDLRRAERCAFA